MLYSFLVVEETVGIIFTQERFHNILLRFRSFHIYLSLFRYADQFLGAKSSVRICIDTQFMIVDFASFLALVKTILFRGGFYVFQQRCLGNVIHRVFPWYPKLIIRMAYRHVRLWLYQTGLVKHLYRSIIFKITLSSQNTLRLNECIDYLFSTSLSLMYAFLYRIHFI